MMWVYLIIGALSVLLGVYMERQTSKSLEYQLDVTLTDMKKLYKELGEKLDELNECRMVIHKLEGKNIALKNLLELTGADVTEYTVEGYDFSKLESVNNHLRTENAGLIRKNKNLQNKTKQYKANVKQLKGEINKLTQNHGAANDLKLQRYKKEIANLHQAIISKNEIINEYTEKYGEL